MSVIIVVITHKEYKTPDNPLYLPVWAGSSLVENVPEGYRRDDEGENISSKNGSYSELTGLYWVWKHLDADYIGVCHYRRYFAADNTAFSAYTGKTHSGRIMTEMDAERIIRTADIVLPSARDYVIETNYSQYASAHRAGDLDAAREVIADLYPSYLDSFNQRMTKTIGHRFNMFIMKRELMDNYCSWLFDILFELERRMGDSLAGEEYSRVFGYISERLLDVWIDAEGYDFVEVPYVMTERENIPAKAAGMLYRKVRAAAKKALGRL